MKNLLEATPQEPTEKGNKALARAHYARSGLTLALFAFRRQLTLVLRNKAYYIARMLQAVVMGLITSSFFAPVSPGNPNDYPKTPEGALDLASYNFRQGRQVLALCVLSVMHICLSSMPAMGSVFETKRVFYKQRDNHFFPTWSYVVSLVFAQVPASTFESILFSIVIYFISGLTRTPGNFFTFLAIIWSASNCFAALVRMIAFFVPTMVIGNAVGSLGLLLLVITNGFSIIRTSIPNYMIWIYWGLNPIAYAIRSATINELMTPAWGAMGPKILEEFGLFADSKWIWIGLGYLWGSLIVMTWIGTLALKYTNPRTPSPSGKLW